MIRFVTQPDAAGGWCGNQSSLPTWYFGVINYVCLERIVYFSLISSRRVYASVGHVAIRELYFGCSFSKLSHTSELVSYCLE